MKHDFDDFGERVIIGEEDGWVVLLGNARNDTIRNRKWFDRLMRDWVGGGESLFHAIDSMEPCHMVQGEASGLWYFCDADYPDAVRGTCVRWK